MWCKKCNRESFNEICDVCGSETEVDIPIEIYWCNDCKTPIIRVANDPFKDMCTLCGEKTKYMAADLRPVFPEERLLIEVMIGKPFKYINNSVWAGANRYYIDGKSKTISNASFEKADIKKITDGLEKYKVENNYESFEHNIDKFCKANWERLNRHIDEAHTFIKSQAAKYATEQVVISFSGGKDSTVTADLTVKALSNPSLVHIFGDTTLEFPATIEYAKRYRKENPKAIFKTARNKEQDFYSVCKDIGPPARMMRWCCSMFKTGPITRVLNGLYREQNILTFYGIRKSESVSRSSITVLKMMLRL